MRILLSAYACEPNKGSEPGIGWNWAIELQRQGHDVVVLTRANNRERIEAFFAAVSDSPRPTFEYYDLPKPALVLKRLGILPLQVYYVLWQVFCLSAARRAVVSHRLELVWHLTFGVVRWPSFLWRLGRPFVFGPVGGGEYAPYPMRSEYGWVGHLRDFLRDVLNAASRLDPMLRATFANAKLILVKTPQSGQLVPYRWQHKVKAFLEVGAFPVQTVREARRPEGRILYVGGFIYLKGIAIAIRAFAEFIRQGGVGRFTLVGKGPEEAHGRALAKELGVDHLIDWVAWVDQRELDRIYAAHDLFLFPSLHDSSGNVIVEALSRGLPVVCFDLGGPGQIVTNDCGVVVATAGLTARSSASVIAAALKQLFDDQAEFSRLSAGALVRAGDFTWGKRVSGAMKELAVALGRSAVG